MGFSKKKKWKLNKTPTKQSALEFDFSLKEMTDIDNVHMMNEKEGIAAVLVFPYRVNTNRELV